MLHVIYGADEYGSAEAVVALQARFEADVDAAHARTRFDGAVVSWPVLRDTCSSRSLFADRQVIVVRGLLAAWAGKAESAAAKQTTSRPAAAELARFVTQMPPTTDLILHEGDLPATNRYLKELAALPQGSARIQACTMPKDAADLEAWAARRISEFVERRGGSIDSRAARLIAQRCACDLMVASNEIDKLLCFTAPLYSIFAQDVEKLVAEAAEARAYDLVDAVAAKQAARTVDLAEKLLVSGQAPEQVLALIGSRVHDLAMLAASRREKVGADVLLERSGWQPWRLRQLERSLGSYTYEDLASAQAILASADLALKTRPSNERPVVALLTVLALARRSDPEALAAAFAY